METGSAELLAFYFGKISEKSQFLQAFVSVMNRISAPRDHVTFEALVSL